VTTFAALAFAPLAVILLLTGCRHSSPSRSTPSLRHPALAADALMPSPRLIIGRIVAVDTTQGFAFVELASDAPAGALVDGTELIARAADLRETARLRSSRYVRGRTLGTKIVDGQPSPSDEVVWLAP
jgi:hypothetical protein